VLSFAGMSILDVRDPSNLKEIGFWTPAVGGNPSRLMGVDLNWPFALLASEVGGLRVVDVSDPRKPHEVGFFDTPYWATDVFYSTEQGLIYLASASSGLYVLRLDGKALDVDGKGKPEKNVSTFSLEQNYPNPFNAATRITYTLGEPAFATLKVYDLLGRPVITLVEGYVGAGQHRVLWDGKDSEGNAVAAGLYEYRLRVGNFTARRRLILLK